MTDDEETCQTIGHSVPTPPRALEILPITRFHEDAALNFLGHEACPG
jgi:hypothetical protein